MLSPPTRRDRLRIATQEEIVGLAMDQVAEGGAAALSLNGVARRMGLSGPAIYRYFSGREALLARLVADVFAGLADALEAARPERGDPSVRLRSIARGYRAWALGHPHQYVLLTTRVREPEARRAMVAQTGRARDVLIAALDDLDPWARPGWAPTFSVVVWQRLHGHMALELEGLHDVMGTDPARLYESELDAILRDALRAGGEVRPRPSPTR